MGFCKTAASTARTCWNYGSKFVTELFKSHSERDKVVKATAAYFEAIAIVVEMTDASDNLKIGFRNTAKSFNDARTAFSIFNGFAGTIPGIFGKDGNIHTIYLLFRNLFENDVNIAKKVAKKFGQNKDKHAYNGTKEKCLGIIYEFFDMLSGGSYFVGFTGFRATQFFARHFGDSKTQQTAKEGFEITMTVMHISKIIGTTVNLVHTGMACFRRDGGNVELKEFLQEIGESLVIYVEKGTEFAKDILNLGKFQFKHRPEVMIGLNGVIGTASLVLAVIKCAREARKE